MKRLAFCFAIVLLSTAQTGCGGGSSGDPVTEAPPVIDQPVTDTPPVVDQTPPGIEIFSPSLRTVTSVKVTATQDGPVELVARGNYTLEDTTEGSPIGYHSASFFLNIDAVEFFGDLHPFYIKYDDLPANTTRADSFAFTKTYDMTANQTITVNLGASGYATADVNGLKQVVMYIDKASLTTTTPTAVVTAN